ncbi:MAG: 6-bladed beta-propeller [Candidatus Aminicenantaceae bacterium]
MRSKCVCHSITFPVALFVMMISCVKQQAGWKGSVVEDNGITIVRNPLTPLNLGRLIALREQVVLKEADESLVRRGLSRIRDFAVDTAGNVFLLTQLVEDDFVFKFDTSGRFIKSFVRKGQGPGELQVAQRLQINARDELTLRDPSRNKLLVCDTDGRFLEEVSLSPDVRHISRLPDGSYLISRSISAPEASGASSLAVVLCDARLNEIKELSRYALSDKDFHDGRIEGRIDAFYWIVDEDRIYVGTDNHGYEIRVFDLAGNLIRRIRKDYLSVPYPEQFKLSFQKAWKRLPQVNIDFPQYLPPFHTFFTDAEDRLFVQTFEPGKDPGTWIHDIFDAEGVFIGRQSLEIAWRGGSLGLYAHALERNGRLYCLQAREGGFHALVVYLMFT